jgi:hypothetical protein
MSTITAILEPQPDGTLHLPLPPELRQGKLKVTATLEPTEAPKPAKAGVWQELGLVGFWMAPDFDAPLEDFKDYME